MPVQESDSITVLKRPNGTCLPVPLTPASDASTVLTGTKTQLLAFRSIYPHGLN